MGAPTDLFDLLAEYLAACEAALVTAPGGLIERAFVSPGLPALDCCPQLTVHAGAPQEADTAPMTPPLSPGHRTEVQGTLLLVQMTATVVRCIEIPETGLPDPVVLETAANVITSDLWAIWNHLRQEVRSQALFPSPSGRREVMFDPALPLAIEGGCGGWQIPIRVQLGGYE